ncbi:MAG TPA: aminopeptidase [Lachnospiraceae bacterium]|nr:aminopeptidase [Lachnospiraceae bacterium]
MERYELIIERIRECLNEETIREPYLLYFKEVASFVLRLRELSFLLEQGELKTLTIDELKHINEELYRDILPQNYDTSYANPAYAAQMLGEYGPYLSFLYAELRGTIPEVYEQDIQALTMYNELFMEIYNLFEYACAEEMLPSLEEVRSALYWFVSDNCDICVEKRIKQQLLPNEDFATRIIMDEDLTDLRYLYYFGEYITDNELLAAQHLNAMSDGQIQAMADVFTEGYRIGFLNNNKDLSKKKVVNIRYSLGFERIIRTAVINFEKMGLQPTIYRAASHSVNKKGQLKIGYYGAIPNKQYEFDHKEDEALYLDKDFINRKLGVLKTVYEENKEWANWHAGPAVMEVFGEIPFTPVAKKEACRLSEKQQKYSVEYASKAGMLVNEYIKGEERSFTIISYPLPEIGTDYQKIFDETVKVNTLDYQLYQSIQQTMIDALDEAQYVEVKGMNGNRTDLCVSLHELNDPAHETIFENCVADVNIPVGEVFTSPKLQGTTGILHVKEVYLEELKYLNLELHFKDGYVSDYSCSNFEAQSENQKYIRDNVLFHHETLPMGEFAIGTNTTAYMMAQRYQIADRLPILIAEKMGPHFAVGDTCYSHCEDLKVFNPDGKEIIARDNEHTILRKEDESKAYYQCHTDITIPYDELGELTAVRADGTRIPMIVEGRFVLPGCEKLNEAFED